MGIRIATRGNLGQLLPIYGPYVEHTAVSFEYEIPSCGNFVSFGRRNGCFFAEIPSNTPVSFASFVENIKNFTKILDNLSLS